MSDLFHLAEGFLEGFTGGGLFVKSRRSNAATSVFAPSDSAQNAVGLIMKLDAMMVEQNSAEYALLRAKVGEEDVAAFRHMLRRFKTAVTNDLVK